MIRAGKDGKVRRMGADIYDWDRVHGKGSYAAMADAQDKGRGKTREDRYEEITGATMPRRDGGSLVAHAAVLRCRSCGSLLLAGDEDIHERMHPSIGCGQAHPQRGRGLGHLTSHAPHAWEEQFQD